MYRMEYVYTNKRSARDTNVSAVLWRDYQSALRALDAGIRLRAITPSWTAAALVSFAAFAAGFHLTAAQGHNSINKCKDDTWTHGPRDSGTGQHIASNALKCAQEKLRCAATARTRTSGRGLHILRMNEVKFTVAHSLSKTKSLSNCGGGAQVSRGRDHGQVPCVHCMLHSRGKDAAAAAVAAVEYVSRLHKLNQCKSINGNAERSSCCCSSYWHKDTRQQLLQAAHALSAQRRSCTATRQLLMSSSSGRNEMER